MASVKRKPHKRPVSAASDARHGIYPADWPMEWKLLQATRHYEIMRDSVELINKTVYPQTFFYRYREALRQAKIIIGLCGQHRLGILAAQTEKALITNRTLITNRFLDRCAAAGKLAIVEAELLAFCSEMPKESIVYLQKRMALQLPKP